MAHRIYLYNIDSKTKEEYPHYLGEWNYEIPELLVPLFAGNPRAKGKLLYFDKEEGVARLRMFYQFLADHHQLNYKKAYSEPVNKMFDFLETLPYDTFVMDATDVFHMNEESHKDQAKEWAEVIRERNNLYIQAEETQDLLSLEKEVFIFKGYDSFLAMLETDWIEYGLGYWNEEIFKNPSETFEENGLWGLKNKKGEVISQPEYQEIFAFNDEGIAVIQKEKKFGYIRNNGIVAVDGIYEDAFDAFDVEGKNYGVVQINGKQGLVSITTGQLTIPCEYDELELLMYKGLFNAKKEEHYHVINVLNHKIITNHSETPFEYGYDNLIFLKQKGTSKRLYYTSEGTFLGEYPEDVLSPILHGYYWVSPHKFQKKISIIKPDGTLLDSQIDKITVLDNYTSFAYRKDKKWYLYDIQQKQFRLTDQNVENIHVDWFTQFMNNVFIVSNENGTGIYYTSEDRWLIPQSKDYKKIESCKQEIFRISVSEGMFYYDQKTNTKSALYDYICEGIDFHEQLLCLFKGKQLLVLDENRELHQVSDFEMGALYEKQYNLRGKDQRYFLDFYKTWQERIGFGFETFFDNETLKSRGNEYRKEGNIKEAIRLYTIGADRGAGEMMTELGFIYTDESIPEFYDLKKGIDFYEKAALQDQPYAWNNLGYHYQNGKGYPQNIKKALECYKKGAELGNGMCFENLAHLYFYGEHVEKDYELALGYYKMAEKKFQFNEANISEIYYQNRDYSNLQRYLKKDYNRDTYSNIYYGILYDHGFGVKQSIKKAIGHYEKALEYSPYFYALERLLHYYKEDPAFADPQKYQYWKEYGEENEMDI
ncbi:hypothetical protein C1631_003995 [Chryseobacterium phosphatilyticum]|uniref:Sel1 repeat family protein n=1 Tax=Chryseobacterium phosphatilyticum TaxID=475075 RepID=A0A316XD64_9FLAO|nr:SEL1-like repeat protein [Chryseobacterium phosphatilyticum]PWN71791.1 hypothetical protein C1631_003995 [Chryseobacterium phosphatilyticum]